MERSGQEPPDLQEVGASLSRIREAHPRFRIWIERGRLLVAGSGVLLTKSPSSGRRRGTLTSASTQPGSPGPLRRLHEVANLSRLDEPATLGADVVGPICESGDVLGYERYLPQPRDSDVILIATAGAHGRSMGSHYILRDPLPSISCAKRRGDAIWGLYFPQELASIGSMSEDACFGERGSQGVCAGPCAWLYACSC